MADGLKFRPLEPDEIEVRVAQAKDNGVSLLLYKDARCDMRMLDDSVGPENWECEYVEIHGALYCTVKIYDEERDIWVGKQDCGVPSNMEGTKGESSDAFKRACFRWGIGRELYTAPFIWVPSDACRIGRNSSGKPACYDRFTVKSIETVDGRIRGLTVYNESIKRVVWSNQNNASNAGKRASNAIPADGMPDESMLEEFGHLVNQFSELCGKNVQQVIDAVASSKAMESAGDYGTWTVNQMAIAIAQIKVWISKRENAADAELL